MKDVPKFLPGSYAYSEFEPQKYKKPQDFQINSIVKSINRKGRKDFPQRSQRAEISVFNFVHFATSLFALGLKRILKLSQSFGIYRYI